MSSLLEGIAFSGGGGGDGEEQRSVEGSSKRRRLALMDEGLFKKTKDTRKDEKKKKLKKDKHSKRKHRSKKEKKHKKNKKHRSSRGSSKLIAEGLISSSSSSDSDSEGTEGEAPQRLAAFQKPASERMGWMGDPFSGLLRQKEEPRAAPQRRREGPKKESGVLATEDLPYGLYDPKAARAGRGASRSEFDKLVAGETEAPKPMAAREPAEEAPVDPQYEEQIARLSALREGRAVEVKAEQQQREPRLSATEPVPARKEVSAEELNKISSKLMRARMKGDKAKIAKLEQKLEDAKAGRLGAPAPPAEQVEVISTFDERGRPISILNKPKGAIEREDLRLGSRKGKKKEYVNMSSKEGRTGYFRDDDVSLEELVRREREAGPEDIDATMARNIVNMGRKYKMTGDSRAGADEDEDVDMKIIEGKDARLTQQALYDKEKKRAIARQRKMDMARERCFYCFKGPAFQRHKHLLVALGEHTMLMFPPLGSRVPDHMLIVPLEHIPSWLDANENTWSEMMMFKSALHQYFTSKGEDVLFLETSMKRHRQRHAMIDVIPMDKEVAQDAPIYFQKAIMEVEEWTSHKKVIDITGKGLRRSIPQGFPYFHVAWKGGGFAHVIEDESEFPPAFGVDVAAGMMGLPPERFGRKANRPSFETERKKVLEFVTAFEPYDWTQQLDQ